jgi:hypothetical protein
MIVFREMLESGLLAENSRDVELGEVFDHMRQRNDHLLRVFG